MLINEIKNTKSSRKELRRFGITVGIALSVLEGGAFWFGEASHPYLVFVGIGLILTGLVLPVVLRPLHRLWVTLAVVLGWAVTRVILGILFYVALTPIGLISRMFGKQFLDLRIEKSEGSYWNYRESREFQKWRYERQF